MKIHLNQKILLTMLFLPTVLTAAADPRLDSWLTTYSAKYARLYETSADQAAGATRTTWSRGTISQTLPAYCGVYEVSSSPSWTYVRTTGLGSHVMGPWYLDAARSMLFPNLPRSSATIFRFPRIPAVPQSRTLTGLGPIGVFVDGVVMFDTRDAFSYVTATHAESNPGDGVWSRDAYVNESVTFDPAYAHQPGSGQYHYHANPPALRFLLDDNIIFDGASRTYSENVTPNAPLRHSPILGWVRDGIPLYGPYGYASATNPASGVRRMISGFVLRNPAAAGVTSRTTLPAWAARAQNRSTTLASMQYGPAVSSTRPLGRYLEDNDYLGDLGLIQGTDFDLDEYNCRYCVTPEFPGGTYAYFTCISSNGTPLFPYNIGRQFFGNPTGGTVANIAEAVATNFVGGANAALRLQPPALSNSADVILTWSSVEGGTYVVAAGTNIGTWSTNGMSSVAATGTVAQLTQTEGRLNNLRQFYKVTRTALAPYAN